MIAKPRRHVQAFAQALIISDNQAIENDLLSPTSPRSPPVPLDSGKAHELRAPPTWKYGPDNGVLSGQERVEKLTATSDFAVCIIIAVCVGS